MLTIRDCNGDVLLNIEPCDGSRRVHTLMVEDYISVAFSLALPVHIGVGSYVVVDGFGRFEITEPQQPTLNERTGGWDYELQFDAHYIKWRNKIFRYIPEDASAEAAWSLTASLDVHMGVFLRNLTSHGYTFNGTPYTFAIDASVANVSRHITYENKSMLDALYEMAETFECEVWVEDSVIRFGRCEYGDAIELRQDANVESMVPEGNRATYATRIYAFGSERNLPTSYRPTSSSIVVNGVVQRRLMLPIDTPYVDAKAGMTTEEAVEQVVLFDDVYPRTESAISDITTTQYSVVDEDGNPTGDTWDAYRLKIAALTFREEYILANAELQVVFQDGLLAGMTFGVKFNPEGESESDPNSQLWEIIRNEDYGRPLPDATLRPNNGDRVVLVGWDASKIASLGLIAAAEQELKQRAIAKMEQLKIDPSNYRCKMISAALFDTGGTWQPYTIGSRVMLINASFVGGRKSSRIIGLEYDLCRPYNTPTYIVGEKSNTSRTAELESKIESLTLAGQTYVGGSGGSGVYVIRTNDSTAASDTNVYSALRTKRDFLSRTHADTAMGKITMLDGTEVHGDATMVDGAQFGSAFASGMTGVGGRIDAHGRGELESLSLRSWLEVPELRYNRAEVIMGDQWSAPGGGIIESVTPDTDVQGQPIPSGRLTLKLEQGEIGAVAVDDICKGYFHDFGTPSNNASADSDDSRGNTQFAGFTTVYFRVTDIVSTDGTNAVLRYALRPISQRWHQQIHPFEGMHFVAYGNFTDTSRQTSKYATRTYERYLQGVADWEFGEANIAAQFGDLSNLSVFGRHMEGYSAYLNNIYMSGVIDQRPTTLPITIEVQSSTGDMLIGAGETLTLTFSAMKGISDMSGSVQSWSVVRDSGNAADDATWSASHSPFGGVLTLTTADVEGVNYSTSALLSITATGDGWTATRTIVVRSLATAASTSRTMRFISEFGEFDTFIAWGERVKFYSVIEDGLRNDHTSDYTGWTIRRHNGDSPDDIASDGVWNATRASIDNNGEFYLTWSDSQDDLQAERATFIVEAQLISNQSISVIGKLSI